MKRTKHLGSYLFLGLASIIFAFPFYFLLVSATNTSLDVTNGRLLPGNALWQNLTNLFSQTQMRGALINSAIVALWQTVLALLVGSVALPCQGHCLQYPLDFHDVAICGHHYSALPLLQPTVFGELGHWD